MIDFKLTISDPKTGKSIQKEVKDKEADVFVGKKIKERIKGDLINLGGYEFEITGGSDYCGFPMRYDIPGMGRKKILAVRGIGLRKKRKGQKQRKTVCGNVIHSKISQINLKIVEYGKEKLFEEKDEKKEEKPEKDKLEKKESKKQEEKKDVPKKEEQKQEVKAEK